MPSPTHSLPIIPFNYRDGIEFIPIDKSHINCTVAQLLLEAEDKITRDIIRAGVFDCDRRADIRIEDLQFVCRRDRDFREYARKKKIHNVDIHTLPLSKILQFEPHISYRLNLQPAIGKKDRVALEQLFSEKWNRTVLLPVAQKLQQTQRELQKARNDLAQMRPSTFIDELNDRTTRLEREFREREQRLREEMEERNRYFEQEIMYRDRRIVELDRERAARLDEAVSAKPAASVRASSSKQMGARAATPVQQPLQQREEAHLPPQQAQEQVVVSTKKPQQAGGLDRSFSRPGVSTRDAGTFQSGNLSPSVAGNEKLLPFTGTTRSARLEAPMDTPAKASSPAQAKREFPKSFAQEVREHPRHVFMEKSTVHKELPRVDEHAVKQREEERFEHPHHLRHIPIEEEEETRPAQQPGYFVQQVKERILPQQQAHLQQDEWHLPEHQVHHGQMEQAPPQQELKEERQVPKQDLEGQQEVRREDRKVRFEQERFEQPKLAAQHEEFTQKHGKRIFIPNITGS